MSKQATREWPLIWFTAGVQLSCGVALAVSVAQWLSPVAALGARAEAIAVFPLATAALACSVLHLGRPFAAWRSFFNLGTSRLSTEVALTAMFAAASFLFSASWLLRGVAPLAVSCATAAFGLLAVVSSARIYTVPAQRFWNSAWVPLSFLSSTLLLGSVVVRPLLADTATAVLFARATQVGALGVLVSAGWMLTSLRRAQSRRYSTPGARPLMSASRWAAWIGSVLLAVLLPLASASLAAREALLLVAACAVAGVLLGRSLMYSLGTRLARF